ncbi:MAG: MHYT domain-containing protein [Roseobacter sp.]
MMEHGHNHLAIVAALAIALVSGFTGLSLTKGASQMTVGRRKLMVAMSAFALGTGIWSMHFVAMLGMRLPIPFYYDALVTMISAFVAILVTGIALLLVHFGTRTPMRITAAGVCLAIGIVAMHYIGMSGIQAVRPVYSTSGIAVALIAALILCVVSFWVSYGRRTRSNILVGTLGFGVAVVSVHFVAMESTGFLAEETSAHAGFWLSNDILAFGVTVTSFVLCGAFLLVSVSFSAAPATSSAVGSNVVIEEPVEHEDEALPVMTAIGKIPYEQNGRIHFLMSDEVAAIRAEGRYTFVYHKTGRLFSPWSISEAQSRVSDAGFIRCHRSYLINPQHVTGFQRKKDNGVCFFDDAEHIEVAPVSRSYLKEVRRHLGL